MAGTPTTCVALLDQLARVRLDREADDVEVRVALRVRLARGLVDELLADRAVLRAEDDGDGSPRRGQRSSVSAATRLSELRQSVSDARAVHHDASADSDSVFAGGRTFRSVTVFPPPTCSTGDLRSTSIMRSTKEP